MDVFHLVIDTSMLRRLPFHHPDFQRLLLESGRGAVRLYIPRIALEELRTHHVEQLSDLVGTMQTNFGKLTRGMNELLVKGLPPPALQLWSSDDLKQNSVASLTRYLADRRIEVIDITADHAANAWRRYFNVMAPFKADEPREARRKDIPDAWILEAGTEVTKQPGIHAALVGDIKLSEAFRGEGFRVYDHVDALLADVTEETAVVVQAGPLGPAAAAGNAPIGSLRSAAFVDMDIIVLGLIELLGAPDKNSLFEAMSKAGINREIAEHEARTLVLSGHLQDTGGRLIPLQRAVAQRAAETDVALDVLARIAG